MPSLKVLVIPGSTRTGSLNVRLAALAAKELTLMDAEANRISLEDYPLPMFDADAEANSGSHPNAVKLKQMICAHQAVFVASPEYNGSVPPVLKNAIDWVSQVRERGEPAYAAFRGRVFALGAASPEPHGGVRGLMALRQILELGCGAMVLPEQIAVPQADDAFDELDNLGQAAVANQLRAQLARLVDVSRMMM
jgi:chromate reductase, NAD(P)H dehydrogenase (quinone)